MIELTVTLQAQMTVNEAGYVSIGEIPKPSGNTGRIPVRASTSSLDIYATGGKVAASISFGPASIGTPSVMVGESSYNSGVCRLHGSNGFLLTKQKDALKRDTLAVYTNPLSGFSFNCIVRAQNFFTPSKPFLSAMAKSASAGSRLAVDDAVNALRGLNAVAYQEGTSGSEAVKKAAATDAGLQYGLNTSDLKELFPSLVYTDSVGNDYVNYIGLVPVLVEAVNNLSSQVAELQASVSAVRPLAVADNRASNISAQTLESSLGQNRPNPFRSVTAIPYTLGDNVVSAAICIYDMQGAQITSYQLDVQDKKGSLEIEGSTLAPGMYLYALIADGMEIATKRMIITD